MKNKGRVKRNIDQDVVEEVVQGLLNIDGHIDFIEKVKDRYKWDAKTKTELDDALDDICGRRLDRRLFLGVIGEFSSGKSTLINALIRERLLLSDVLQATTSSATVLCHGDYADAEVIFQSGIAKNYQRNGLSLENFIGRWLKVRTEEIQKSELRKFVRNYSSDETQACSVVQVNVRQPNDVLRQGLVIVDTPGTNVDNTRHVEVTTQAIRDLCDAAVVVVPADIPVSQSLLGFLRTHLSGLLHRCVFVLTKIDLIKGSERARLLSYVRAVLKRELEIADPVVLPAAPQLVVDTLAAENGEECEGICPAEDRRLLIDQFTHTEASLYRIMDANRFLIVMEKITLCLGGFFENLPTRLKKLAAEYRHKHEQLVKNKIPDLTAFVSEQEQKYSKSLAMQTDPLVLQVTEETELCRSRVQETLRKEIAAVASPRDLKSIAEKRAAQLLASAAEELRSTMTTIGDQICLLTENLCGEFQEEFEQAYSKLTGLSSLKGSSRNGRAVNLSIDGSSLDGVAILISDLNTSVLKDDLFKYGGVGLGATIGGILTVGNPVGIFIGGFLGSIAGKMFGSPLDDLRAKTLASIEPAVEIKFLEARGYCEKLANKMVKDANKTMKGLIDHHFVVYENKVNEMIAEDEERKLKLQHIQQQIKNDLTGIETRIKQISSAQQKIKSDYVLGG